MSPLLISGFAIYGVYMLPVWFGYAPSDPFLNRLLIVPACVLMLFSTMGASKALTGAFRVLGQLRAPGIVWQGMMRKSLLHIALVWLLLALSTGMHFGLAGPALMSVLACMAVLDEFRDAGWLTQAQANVLMVLNPALGSLLGTQAVHNVELPTGILLPLALLCPAMLLWLLRRWERAAPLYRWPATRAEPSWGEKLGARMRRYTVLDYSRPVSTQGRVNATVVNPAMLVLASMPSLLVLLASITLRQQQALTMAQILVLPYATLLLSYCLIARDLHWRSFLLPGGMRRGHIALRIWMPTMKLQLTSLLVWIVLCFFVRFIAARYLIDLPAPNLATISLMLIELTFATSLALLLRALPRAKTWIKWTALWVVVEVSIFVIAGFLLPRFLAIPMALGQAGYMAMLLAASMLLLAASGRLWTLPKLFPRLAL
jgi:hypothetical protein